MSHVPWVGNGIEYQDGHKSIYSVNHGLAPYFKTLLQTTLEKSGILSYSFDESLNEVTLVSETDLFVRFWDGTDKCVKVRYYGSTFLENGGHTSISNHLTGMTKYLKPECYTKSQWPYCEYDIISRIFGKI